MQQIETTTERLGPLASATLRPAAGDPFEVSVAPGDVFRRSRDVLTYPGLSLAEKRAVLASWASDARAAEPCPTLRCLPGCRAEPVPLHEVLAALQALDGDGPAQPSSTRRHGVPGVRSRIAGTMDSYHQCRAELRQGVELWRPST